MVDAALTALWVAEPPGTLVGILALDDILRAPFGRTLVATDRWRTTSRPGPRYGKRR